MNNQLTSQVPSPQNSPFASSSTNALMPNNNPQPNAQPQQAAQLPPPKLSQAQLQQSAKTSEVAINGLAKIATNDVILQNPDKLQKALLASAADIYKASGGHNTPSELISHAMDVMKDPRGPKAAIQDKIAELLSNLSSVDLYSRQIHGSKAISPSNFN